MDTRSIAAEYRLSHWAQVVQDRAERGLTVREYCEETGICENTYFYWQRKLRAAASARAADMSAGNSLTPRGWTALSIRGKSATADGLIVEVGDCRVHVHADTDTGLLARVCQALRAL